MAVSLTAQQASLGLHEPRSGRFQSSEQASTDAEILCKPLVVSLFTSAPRPKQVLGGLLIQGVKMLTLPFFFFFNLFYYLFIFSRAGSSLLHRVFSVASGAPLESQCSGLSLQRLLLQSTGPGACRLQRLRCMRSAVASGLQSTSSTVVLHGLSCSMACAISIEPGMELMSPALAGRVLSTEPPGSPNSAF